ncbi:MAG: hypothetical protein NZ992_07320 [Candidatus Korarchaeum sp.]|nr:hypothetical protein [Candidatus Korarchaeum sp.]MDW8036227.1 hypothetical protein [Candidatus Korarchaeum sp.]
MSEAFAVARIFGWCHIEVRKGRFFLRKDRGRCPFLSKLGPFELCYLQEIGVKPKACKIWPFHIFENPEYGKKEEATFSSKYGTFYVYVDSRCPGITIGRPNDMLVNTVLETLEIWLGVRTEQFLTTGKITPLRYSVRDRYP